MELDDHAARAGLAKGESWSGWSRPSPIASRRNAGDGRAGTHVVAGLVSLIAELHFGNTFWKRGLPPVFFLA
jgi:hypothetical protein